MTERNGYQQAAPWRKTPGRPDTGTAASSVELPAQN
jgi:hypothetical protein